MVKDVVSRTKLVAFTSLILQPKLISVTKTNLLSLYFVASFGSRRVVVVVVGGGGGGGVGVVVGVVGVVVVVVSVVVVVVVGVVALLFLLLSFILVNWKINPANNA